MAAVAKTPRRALTPEEKKQEEAVYRVEVKQFGEILKSLVQVHSALFLLNTSLGQAGKGAYLAFPNPNQQGTYIPFNRKHLRSASAKFAKAILLLKKYFSVSKKKTREPVRPESFSGTYTPVFAGDALISFFTANPAGFGPLQPAVAQQTQQAGQALMQSLPMVSQGYLLRNTSTMLFYIYAHANQLQDAANAQFARSDASMDQAFGGNIPAAFYSYKDADGKAAKVTMAEAVSSGLITAPLNTYQVIRSSYPEFNPQRFNTYFYQNIAAANYYSRPALAAQGNQAQALQAQAQALQAQGQGEAAQQYQQAAQQAQRLANAGVQLTDVATRQQMLNEHNIVKQVSAEWHDILEPTRKQQRDARKKVQDQQRKAQKQQQGIRA